MSRSNKFTNVLFISLLSALSALFAGCGGSAPIGNNGASAVPTATPTASPSTSPTPTPTPLPCDTQINRNLYNAIRAVPELKAQMSHFTGFSKNCKVILVGYVDNDALFVQTVNVASGVRDNSNNRIQGLDVLDFVSHREAYKKLHPDVDCAPDEKQCGEICIKIKDECWPGAGDIEPLATPTPTRAP